MRSLRGVIVALVAALVAATPASARTGRLDRDFGRRGLVRTSLGSGADVATAVAVQADGRIVVAGHSRSAGGTSKVALVRHRADGALDPSFGRGGKVLAALPEDAEIEALALGPDGEIVVAGSTSVVGGRAAFVARFLADGAPDPSFGDEGRFVLEGPKAPTRARALAITADGAAVIAGAEGAGSRQRFLVFRLDRSGRLDPTFGQGGLVAPEIDAGAGSAFAIALQEDRRIVLAGRVRADLAALRLEPSGAPDEGFGRDGLAVVDVGKGLDVARGVVVAPDRSILLAGTTTRSGDADFVVARLDEDGDLDATFGVRRTDLGGAASAHAVALLPSGTAVVAGQVTTSDGADVALVAYRPDGSLEPSFGHRGRVRTDLQSAADGALGLALQADGKLLAAGVRGEGVGTEMVLLRYADASAECGDGFVEGDETCDLGSRNGETTSCCSASCALRLEGEPCRESEGLCDPVEVCTGAAPVCPPDEIAPAETSCRPAAGWCDLPEECTGASKRCPDDRLRDRGVVCRAAVGACDATELCDGETAACPDDAKSTKVCRPATGDCDLPERCDGASDECPDDLQQENGNACHDRNPCTVDESCHEGECIGGTFEPFACGAMRCQKGDITWRTEFSVDDALEFPLVDAFEEGTLRISREPRKAYFCSRASVTGELWAEAADSGSGARDAIADASPVSRHRLDVGGTFSGRLIDKLIVHDRFGRRPVRVNDARVLSVPAAVEVPGAASTALRPDARKCYPVRGERSVGARRLPLWVDGDPVLFDLKKLMRVCVPATFAGNPPASDIAVTCYGAHLSRGQEGASPLGAVDVVDELGHRATLSSNGTKDFVCLPAVVENPVSRVARAPESE